MKEKQFDVYFLGAGKPISGQKPSALKEIRNGTRAIDWQLHSFDSIGNVKFHFLGGYQISDVAKQYPQLHYTVIPDWRSQSIIHTLFQAPFRRVPAIITYADTIFRKQVIDTLVMTDGDVIFAYDGRWKKRYEARAEDDISNAEIISINDGCYQETGTQTDNNAEMEFTGLIKLSPKVAEFVSTLREEQVGINLLDLIKFLASIGYSIKSIDVDGHWAEFNSPKDIAHFVLGTKADTLARLAPLAKLCHIGEQFTFTVRQWEENPQNIISNIQKKFPETKLVIRSSTRDEDGWCYSNAGGFDSVLNIDSCLFQKLYDAIEMVIDSYRDAGSIENNQILVQKCIHNVKCSGVVFTRTLETGSPYYRINFDDKTSQTDAVTAGLHNELRTVVINRSVCIDEISIKEPALAPVIQSVRELEELLGFDNLDIEFAIDQADVVHIFQVRPITVDHSHFEFSDVTVDKYIRQGANCFTRLQKKSPFILGDRTFFGNMPDWNPAEIIGIRPKPLALSLYQFLITNNVWAIQRAEFGYRDVRPHPLIVSFCGQPYVDIRASLNSFIPATLADDTAEKLVDCYLSILTDNPELHDKIEFDVAFTVWTPSFSEEAKKRLIPYGFNSKEIAELGCALLKITQNAVNRLDEDIASVQKLIQRRKLFKNSKQSSLEQALSLLDDCKRFGTLAFSHTARAGFIATSFLKSIVSRNIITQQDFQSYLNSIQTITGELEINRAAVNKGEMEKTDLIERFGHLRPGTYDVEMLAYWESPERYLLSHSKSLSSDDIKKSKFSFSSEARQFIQKEIKLIDESMDFDFFINYIEKAIQSRELVKFEFTRNLSIALDKLIQYGKQINLKRQDINYLNIDEFEQLRLGSLNDFSLKILIDVRKKNYILSQMIELPQLLFKESDFYCFERHEAQPNFVTTKKIDAEILVWTGNEYEQLENRIVLIPQADPGYDWLFSQNIVGLVTKYGGANSHMTIRAAEMGLPAAIGVGDKLYERLSHSKKIQIDCVNQIIRPIT